MHTLQYIYKYMVKLISIIMKSINSLGIIQHVVTLTQYIIHYIFYIH